MKRLMVLVATGVCVLVGGCDLAPPYESPALEIPDHYKEGGGQAGATAAKASREGGLEWSSAAPADLRARGPWWRPFKDKELDRLETELDAQNPNIDAAVAAVDRSRALAARAMAGLSPVVTAGGRLSENKQSLHRPLRTANSAPGVNDYARAALSHGLPLNAPTFYGDNQLGLQASYEIDLWGRVRNFAAASAAQAEASEADLAALGLSLEAELARDYIGLKGLDAEFALQRRIIDAYTGSLGLVQKLVDGGISSPADVTRAQTQLDLAKAQLLEIEARRALLEHALAVLVGRPPERFALRASPESFFAPRLPLGVPSQLLERRPDIAAAERRVLSANQTIGVARAAFFPRFTINLSGGTQDTGLSLFNVRNSVWSLGPAVTLPIFDGGARQADLRAAEASYIEAVADYRGAVLRALAEVEDAAAQIRFFDREEKAIASAVVAANKTLDVSLKLYAEGVVTYVEVVTAQSDAFTAQRQAISLRTARLQASFALIVALGGGWSAPFVTEPEPAVRAPEGPRS